MSEFVLMEVTGLDDLYEAIDRAYSKGYLPDAIREAWDAFDFRPSEQNIEPFGYVAASEVPHVRGGGRGTIFPNPNETITVPVYLDPRNERGGN